MTCPRHNLSVVRRHYVEQPGGCKQCRKVFCATVTRINWRLSFGGAASSRHSCPSVIACNRFNSPEQDRHELCILR